MMKRMFCILLFLMLLFSLLGGCGENPYNNNADKDELITKTYPESIYEQIQYRLMTGGLHIDGLREIVDVECLRKTNNGSYAILKLDNQKYAYILIDKNDQCQQLYQFSESFYTRSELEGILETVTYQHEVDAFSPNAMVTGISCAQVIVYPVVEGYIIAIFMYDRQTAEYFSLQSVEFYEDIADSFLWGDRSVSQILDIDRCKTKDSSPS